MSATGHTEVGPVSWRDLLSGPNGRMFAVLSLGVWLHAADSTVVATLLPGAVSDIGGATYISWNFVLYELASIAAACCAALVARRFGLRRSMIWSGLAVAVGCALSASTPVMAGMLVGRTIQGAGGGLLVALTMVGVASLFPSNYTPRAMAAIAAVWGSSSFVGPLIGGVFAEMGLWRMGFWAFAAQGLVVAAALRWSLPADAKTQDDGARIPWRRLSVLSLGVLAIAGAGLEEGMPLLTVAIAALGLVGMALFLKLDRQAGDANRLLPKITADLRSPGSGGFVGVFLLACATVPFAVYGPILLGILHGTGPLAAGYMIALESVAWTVGALLLAKYVGTIQIRIIRWSFIGSLIGCAGLLFIFVPGPVWAMLPFVFLLGLGFGAAYGHIVQRCVDLVPAEDKDRAAGAMPTIQTIGYAVGAAVTGLVANLVGFGHAPSPAAAADAAHWIFAVMVPVGVLAVLSVYRIPAGDAEDAPDVTAPHAPEGGA